tara:strand:- start:1745 stop:2278 length:534 start_codon:yes stop_codon:yes gene_type:complete
MAKTESFFIRATVTPDNSGNFVQTNIDLSSYVNALGKSILLVKSIEGEWCQAEDSTDIPNGAPKMTGDTAASAIWQLTTQNNTGLVSLDDRTTIAKGSLWARNPDTTDHPPSQVYSDSHLPQHYSNGFLVAVEEIYLGARGGTNWLSSSKLTFNIVLECEVLQMTASAALALALSQQ